MTGKVILSDTIYIDFDTGYIYESGQPIHQLTNLQYGVLEHLILNAGHTVSVESIIENVWGYDYEGENANQNVRDIISQIRAIPSKSGLFEGNNYIHTNRGRGYFVTSDVTVEDHTLTTVKNEFDFCKKFLHSGATALVDKDQYEILDEIHKISKLFVHNTFVKHELEFIDHQDSIADFIIRLISELNQDTHKMVLKVKGPLGAYKNRLLQYIFLYISLSDHHVLPFYIDISMYEKIKTKPDADFKNDLKQAIEEDLAYVKEQIIINKQRVPLVILDGIRDFSCGKDFLYSYLQKVFENIDCKLIVSVDTDFTNNPRHKFRVHPFITTDYEYFIRIKSLELYRRDESIDFIKNAICLFDIKLPSLLTPELIYEKLVKLNLISIDAYWFKNLVEIIINNIMRDEFTIVDLYEALCRKSLQSTAMIDSAANLAYEFEYGDMSFSDSEFFFDDRWKVIRKHRSMLDYLLARNYITQFEALQSSLKNGDASQNLHFFNFVLPKNVTRFVTIMFEMDDYENTILSIAEKYYDSMSTFGKTELIYWLGRLKNPNRKTESLRLLQNYKQQQFTKYSNMNSKKADNNEIKKQAFLLRGIYISLIQSDDKTSSKEYFDLLLNDKLTNKINRGFHLEYYGDKPYIPSKTRLDFEDDVSKGENTFNSLCIYISDSIRNNKVNCNTILELLTLCSLIQARVEGDKNNSLFINTYLCNVINYLKWIQKQRYINEFQAVKRYFNWILNEINAIYADSTLLHNNAKIFNLYSQTSRIERTGWINRKIEKPETVSGHMYSCWLIGLLYLPNNYNDSSYDKSKILKMLLIHDIGETVTGDIPRPEKEQNKAYYDSRENDVMQEFFLAGTYPSMANMKDFQECWNEWYDDNSLNSDIAKDIDEIQAIYQLCVYYRNKEICIDVDDFRNWCESINYLRTDIVKEIANTLIRKNPEFHDFTSDIFGE